MNLYLLINNTLNGYDTYDSCVVAAPNFRKARTIHPKGSGLYVARDGRWHYDTGDVVDSMYLSWPQPEALDVLLIGRAEHGITPGVICSSFNAG